MKRRIIALLLALCLVFQAAPVFAGAAEGQKVTAGVVTVTAGKSASVTLKAENFQNIASFEVFVYYDPSVLTLSSTTNGTKLSGAQAAVNTDELGTVKLVAMSLTGISGTGNLLTLNFTTTEDCAPGTYPITVAIGNAYDTTFNPASITGASGSVTVNAPPVTVEEFRIYAYPDKTTLQKGDMLSFRVASASSLSFVSGDFIIDYDSQLFAFDSLQLESKLEGEGAIYSINASVAGQVRLVYVNENPVSEFYLFRVNLKVIGDVDTSTQFAVRANNVYREDLSPYGPGQTSRNITLTKLPTVEDYPNVFLETEKLVVGQQSKSTLWLEGGSGVAAANFTVSYDPAVLRCVVVEMAEQPETHDVTVIINDKYADGLIRFSYLNMDGVEARDVPMVDITWEPIQSPAAHMELTTGGASVVNINQQPISLEYKKDTGCVFTATVQPATCQKEGLITYLCGCGAEDTPQVLPVLPEEECTHYTVRFVDHDGTEISAAEYHLGDAVVAPEDPFRVEDDACTYVFSGWDEEVVPCAGNATYTATYEPTYKEYTVIFLDEDGTELSKKTYHWGDEIEVPADPTKAADDTYTYVFSGWNEEVTECKGNATYTATYKSTYKEYTVKFVDEDGTLISSKIYHWGDKVEVPADPTKAADDTYTYTFSGWDKEIVACAGDATYAATYAATIITYAENIVDRESTPDDTVVQFPNGMNMNAGIVNSTLNATQTKSQLAEIVSENIKDSVSVTVAEAINALGNSYDADKKEPVIEIQSYLTASYSKPVVTTTNSSMTVMLNAWYQLYAVQGSNSAAVGEAVELDVADEAITIALVLPDEFAINANQTVRVKHTKNDGTEYIYRCEVQTDEMGKRIVSFVNPNGFSKFEILASMQIDNLEATLSLRDEVCYNFYFAVTEELEGIPLSDMGLLVWNTEPAEPNYETAEKRYPGAVAGSGNFSGKNKVTSAGVAAKNMADTQYFCIYVRKGDDSYIYSKVFSYSAKRYADSRIANSTNEKLVATCVALLNYGAAAQEYFANKPDSTYTYESLMNEGLTAEQKVVNYSAEMISAVGAIDASKTGAFTATADAYSKKEAKITLGGALSANYYFTTTQNISSMKLYYWTKEAYDAAEVLTKQNATGIISMTREEGNVFKGSVRNIAAKDFDKTMYVCGVYEIGGESYCTGIIAYSIGRYCNNMASGTSAVRDLARALTVYGYQAKLYLKDR